MKEPVMEFTNEEQVVIYEALVEYLERWGCKANPVATSIIMKMNLPRPLDQQMSTAEANAEARRRGS